MHGVTSSCHVPLSLVLVLVGTLPSFLGISAFIPKTSFERNNIVGNVNGFGLSKSNHPQLFKAESKRMLPNLKENKNRKNVHFSSVGENDDYSSYDDDDDNDEPWVLRAMTLKDLDRSTEPQLLSDFLLELGACSISLTDHHRGTDLETPIYNEPGQTEIDNAAVVLEDAAVGMNVWTKCDVTAHFPASIDLAEVADAVRYTFGMATTPRYDVDQIPDLDWIQHVQSSWKPFVSDQGAKTFVLKFPWHTEEDVQEVLKLHNDQNQSMGREEVSSDDNSLLEINLEGGIAFGTGEHPTTQLCLGWISDLFHEENVDDDDTVSMFLDYGAGSGVLGIAACLCSDKVRSVGVEIDADAILIANANSKRNNVNMESFLPANLDEDDESASLIMKARARTDVKSLPADFDGPIYDACAANILAGPLIGLVGGIASMIKPGGKLGLSGILQHQGDNVVEAYSEYFDDVKVSKELGGWVLVTGTRKIV